MNNPRPWQKKEMRRITRKRQKSFCIFTEGETEKIYFNDFGLATVKVRSLGGGGVLHLVSEALSYMKQSKYSGYDYYWLVFDKDDNSSEDIQSAIRIADKNKISWCFSNPCFEIWYLFHFDYFQTPTTAKDLKTRLIPDRIPGYTETMPGVFDFLADKQLFAKKNSQKLWPQSERTSYAAQLRTGNGIPITNADNLVHMLNSNNK